MYMFIYNSNTCASEFLGLVTWITILTLKILCIVLYCLYFWDSPNLQAEVPVIISPRSRVAQLYPQALGSSN
jgi:hypothetical protein